MNSITNFVGKEVEVEISGKTVFSGKLVEFGSDILVVYSGEQFLYIPLMHMHHIKEKINPDFISHPPADQPLQNMTDPISYRKTLNNAKGQFIEIFVTGNRAIHGYITSVLNDYIVFYSPVYKVMFLSMHHIKWLIPYHNQSTPYLLNKEELPVVPASIPLARSFDEQLAKYSGKLVVFDMGDHPHKIGVLKSISNNIVQIITANGESVFWKLMHLKTMNIP